MYWANLSRRIFVLGAQTARITSIVKGCRSLTRRNACSVPDPDRAAILVDFDGTLYRQTPVRLLVASELLLFDPGVIGPLSRFRREQERLRQIPPESAQVCADEDSPFHRQLARSAAESGIAPEQMRAIVDEWMFRRPGKWLRRFVRWPLVRELQARQAAGVRLAVISDYPVSRKLAALSLPLAFDIIVASGEPGGPRTLKPSPEGCLLAASRLGIAPGRCTVVGDREDVDGVAARRAGMSFRLVR